MTCAYNSHRLSLTALLNILRWSKKSYLMIILYKNNIYIMKLQPLFFKVEMFPLKIMFKVFSRSKGQNLTKMYDFFVFCKTFHIFSIFTSTFIFNYHLKICVFALMCLSKSLLFILILWDFYGSEWCYVTCSRNTHFADSSIQHTQMKHGITFNDNTLQKQQVYSKVITLV